MSDAGEPRSSGGGSGTMILAMLLIVVLVVVLWFVFAGGGGRDEGDVEVNVPTTEVDVPENVDVNVKSSGDNNP